MRAAGGGPLSSTAQGPAGVARRSLGDLLRHAARIDRSQSDPAVALRNAVGVAAPLAVGALAGNAALGLATTVGALQAAFADRPGPYRLRMLRMLGTGLAAAVTSGLAVVCSRSDAASVVLLLVLTLIAGLLLTGGPSAAQVGIAAVAAAIVLGHTPQPPSVALHVGLLVLAGGAIQAALAVAAWPLGRHRPERLALAGLYRELATAARLPAGTRVGPPAGDTLVTVRQTLYGLGHDHGPSVEAYRVLLDEAERIRREVVVLTGMVERLARDRNPILAGFVRESLTAAGQVLDEVAAALERGRTIGADVLAPARATVRFAVGRLEDSSDAPGELTRRAAAGRLRALAGQLRGAVESAGPGASEGRRGAEQSVVAAFVRDPVAILRANLTPDSAVLRHAVRLAVVVAGSDLVVRVAGYERGYWVALTALVVLRPDFGSTLQRALLRTIGTVLGLLVASELVHWVPGGQWWQVALVLAFAFGMRFAGPGNVGLSAVSLSGLVVVLLSLAGVPAHETLVDRAVATLVGGGLAVLASVLFPFWERAQVPARLAALIGAYLDYTRAVADLGDDPQTVRELQRTRGAARLARSNAEASVDRARAEPVPAARTVELGRTVLAHTHRFVHAMLAVDAVRVPLREAGGSPELTDFLVAVVDVLATVRVSVATGTPPASPRRLRPLYGPLAQALTTRPLGGVETASVLVESTDRITNSLDTLVAELRRQLGDRDDVTATVPT